MNCFLKDERWMWVDTFCVKTTSYSVESTQTAACVESCETVSSVLRNGCNIKTVRRYVKTSTTTTRTTTTKTLNTLLSYDMWWISLLWVVSCTLLIMTYLWGEHDDRVHQKRHDVKQPSVRSLTDCTWAAGGAQLHFMLMSNTSRALSVGRVCYVTNELILPPFVFCCQHFYRTSV